MNNTTNNSEKLTPSIMNTGGTKLNITGPVMLIKKGKVYEIISPEKKHNEKVILIARSYIFSKNGMVEGQTEEKVITNIKSRLSKAYTKATGKEIYHHTITVE
jgi:hypothetical protein